MSDANWAVNNRKSILGIEWTNQHGCGGNELGDPWKLNCELILQYMCTSETLVYDVNRDDCTFECFVPTTQNPTCLSGTPAVPGCPVVEMEQDKCIAAGYRWSPAQYYDQYNCPHKCTANGANVDAGSRASCESVGGAWTTMTSEARFRDGLTTRRQDYTEPTNNELSTANDITRKARDDKPDRGLHESWEFYDSCYRRERNRGVYSSVDTIV
jgi:hypothetical protein